MALERRNTKKGYVLIDPDTGLVVEAHDETTPDPPVVQQMQTWSWRHGKDAYGGTVEVTRTFTGHGRLTDEPGPDGIIWFGPLWDVTTEIVAVWQYPPDGGFPVPVQELPAAAERVYVDPKTGTARRWRPDGIIDMELR